MSFAAWGCTAVALTGKTVPLLAVNLDWPRKEVGLIVIHPRHGSASISPISSIWGHLPLPGEDDPLSRFVRAATALQRLPLPIAEEDKMAYAFNVLSEVIQPVGTKTATQVSMVFDLMKRTIYFRTINNAHIRFISLDDIHFDELKQPIFIDGCQHQCGNILPAHHL